VHGGRSPSCRDARNIPQRVRPIGKISADRPRVRAFTTPTSTSRPPTSWSVSRTGSGRPPQLLPAGHFRHQHHAVSCNRGAGTVRERVTARMSGHGRRASEGARLGAMGTHGGLAWEASGALARSDPRRLFARPEPPPSPGDSLGWTLFA
jgi:hypothetical protein